MTSRQLNVGIALSLILLAVVLRLLPHPDNFVPIGAVAIFGGALLPRRYALIVPLAAMVSSDLIIGLHDLIWVTWGSYGLIAWAANRWLSDRTSLGRVLAMAGGASVFFFVVSNFAVWVSSGMYRHTWAGLIECYALAIPFFRNTLMGDLVYTVGLFGLYELSRRVANNMILKTNPNQNNLWAK